MTTIENPPSREELLARIEALRAARPNFRTTDGRLLDDLPEFAPAPRPHHFKKGGLLAQAKELSLSDDAKELTAFLDSIPFAEAIRLWGKPQADFKSVGGSSVLIRCPRPDHTDNNPSASADLEQGLFRCHACETGGDRYTLAALHHGVENYQNGKNFVDLKTLMATDLGYTVTETGGQAVLSPPSLPAPIPTSFEDNPAPPAPAGPVPVPLEQLEDGSLVDPTTGEIVSAPAPQPAPAPAASTEDEDDAPRIRPTLDWVPLGRNGSFIDVYMSCVERQSYPEEFAFASALICLGFVGNHHVCLANQRPVKGALGVVAVADTGSGKTTAFSDAKEVLSDVMPWHPAELAIASGGTVIPGHGVIRPSGVGSGENLIKHFEDIVKVPSGTDANGNTIYEEVRCPVNGLITYDELSHLIGKASMRGSTLRERIFQFLDTPRDDPEASANTTGHFKASKPFASLCTTVQPQMVSSLFSGNDEHSGYLNRLVFFTGEKRPTNYLDFEPIDLGPAKEALRDLKEFWEAKGDILVGYEQEAALLMNQYQKTVSEPLQESAGIMGRLPYLFHKLTLLLAINEKSTKITVDIINKAIKLHQYLIATYKYLSGELYDPSVNENDKRPDTEDRIVARIRKVSTERRKKGLLDPSEFGLTATEIRTSVKRHFDVYSSPSAALQKTLAGLVDIGTLVKVSGQRGARYILSDDV